MTTSDFRPFLYTMRASVTILVLLLVLAALVTADLQSVVSAQSTDTDGTFSLVCAGSSLTFEMATIADIEVPRRAEISPNHLFLLLILPPSCRPETCVRALRRRPHLRPRHLETVRQNQL